MSTETLRPRYGRIAAFGASTGVALVALLGGVGVLPTSAENPPAVTTGRQDSAGSGSQGALRPAAGVPTGTPGSAPRSTPTATPTPTPTPSPTSESSSQPTGAATAPPTTVLPQFPLPARSGQGRRVVFSESQQRVWLVGSDGVVQRTYLVSGSLYDNLDPGRYAVYSRSPVAWGIDDSGTMRWFVRFTQGDNAAIGFHSIPVDNGKPVQTVAQLGTPLSHGCIRQRTSDARAMWAFAQLDTRVVVV